MPDEQRSMTVQEAGRLGGRTTTERYGGEAQRAGGRTTGARNRERGPDYFRETGRKGGTAVKAKYGRDHYVELGKKGSAIRQEKDAARSPHV